MDKEVLEDLKYDLPSELLKIRNEEDREDQIGFIIRKINTELKEYGGKLNTNDVEKKESYTRIIHALREYKKVLADITRMPQYQTGRSIFLNANEMVERLNLLVSAKEAGNDSLEIHNEIVDILDQLIQLKLINKAQHKKIYKNFLL